MDPSNLYIPAMEPVVTVYIYLYTQCDIIGTKAPTWGSQSVRIVRAKLYKPSLRKTRVSLDHQLVLVSETPRTLYRSPHRALNRAPCVGESGLRIQCARHLISSNSIVVCGSCRDDTSADTDAAHEGMRPATIRIILQHWYMVYKRDVSSVEYFTEGVEEAQHSTRRWLSS